MVSGALDIYTADISVVVHRNRVMLISESIHNSFSLMLTSVERFSKLVPGFFNIARLSQISNCSRGCVAMATLRGANVRQRVAKQSDLSTARWKIYGRLKNIYI